MQKMMTIVKMSYLKLAADFDFYANANDECRFELLDDRITQSVFCLLPSQWAGCNVFCDHGNSANNNAKNTMDNSNCGCDDNNYNDSFNGKHLLTVQLFLKIKK